MDRDEHLLNIIGSEKLRVRIQKSLQHNYIAITVNPVDMDIFYYPSKMKILE